MLTEDICGVSGYFYFMGTCRTATLKPVAAIPQYLFIVLTITDMPIGGGGGGGGGGGLSSKKIVTRICCKFLGIECACGWNIEY